MFFTNQKSKIVKILYETFSKYRDFKSMINFQKSRNTYSKISKYMKLHLKKPYVKREEIYTN